MNVRVRNADGSWSVAVPLPFYSGIFKRCPVCWLRFLRARTYQDHYKERHA